MVFGVERVTFFFVLSSAFYNVSCCDPEAAAKPKSSKNSGVLTGKSTRHSEKQIFEQRYHTLLLRFGPYIASTYLEVKVFLALSYVRCSGIDGDDGMYSVDF